MIREPNIVVGLLSEIAGYRFDCSRLRLGGRYVNTRDREILDNLIREKVNDVEVMGMILVKVFII